MYGISMNHLYIFIVQMDRENRNFLKDCEHLKWACPAHGSDPRFALQHEHETNHGTLLHTSKIFYPGVFNQNISPNIFKNKNIYIMMIVLTNSMKNWMLIWLLLILWLLDQQNWYVANAYIRHPVSPHKRYIWTQCIK